MRACVCVCVCVCVSVRVCVCARVRACVSSCFNQHTFVCMLSCIFGMYVCFCVMRTFRRFPKFVYV